MGKYYAYIRDSRETPFTAEQRTKIAAYCINHNIDIAEMVEDIGVSSRNLLDTELWHLLKTAGPGDTIIYSDNGRLTRHLDMLPAIISVARHRGIGLLPLKQDIVSAQVSMIPDDILEDSMDEDVEAYVKRVEGFLAEKYDSGENKLFDFD